MSQTIAYEPQPGMNWSNFGSAGSSCNATCGGSNGYVAHAGKGPTWWYGVNNYTCIPANSYTNNQNVVSWEIGFHFSGLTTNWMQKLWDKGVGGYSIYLDTRYESTSGTVLTLSRYTTGGSNRWYIPVTTKFHPGHDYYVQIAWNSGTYGGWEGYPNIYIATDGGAPVHQTSWDESAGALSAQGNWYNDSVSPANIGNYSSSGACPTSGHGYYLNGTLYVYRQYNNLVDFSGGGSWAADKYRWLGNPQLPTTCSINASNTHPVTGSTYQIYGHLQTTGGSPVPNQPITVFYSLDNQGTWHWATNHTTTNSNGDYSYDQTAFASPGEWEYIMFSATGSYAGCLSAAIQVVGTTATSIVLNIDNITPAIDQNFTLSYVLRDQYLAGLAGRTGIVWQQPQGSSVWAAIYWTTTNSSGTASYTLSKATAGTFTYAIGFAGDSAYAGSTSNYVPVTIMGVQQTASSETATLNTSEPVLPKFTITETGTLVTTEGVLVRFTKTETDTLI